MMASSGRGGVGSTSWCRRLSALVGLAWLGAVWNGVEGTEAVRLRAELEELAIQAGFGIEGLERIGPEPAEASTGTPEERLKGLLRDYNYLLIQGRPGSVEKVLITSRKSSTRPGSADSAHIGTLRLGAHHQVEAALAGPNGVAKILPLLIDTGASTLVLSAALIPELGFAPEELVDSVAQTAAGTVPVKIGLLRSVRVGPVTAHDVQASFIADGPSQGAQLLGMSFLQRFRITLDDARNELILWAK
jgi:aspartyl protease family protein